MESVHPNTAKFLDYVEQMKDNYLTRPKIILLLGRGRPVRRDVSEEACRCLAAVYGEWQIFTTPDEALDGLLKLARTLNKRRKRALVELADQYFWDHDWVKIGPRVTSHLDYNVNESVRETREIHLKTMGLARPEFPQKVLAELRSLVST